MFDYDNTLELLQDFKHFSPKKQKKIIKRLFKDETFIEWLFQPKKVPNLNEMVSALYGEFTKPEVMEAIVDTVKEEGYHSFTRSHATFIYSIANIAIQGNNDMLKNISAKKKEGEISSKDARKMSEKMDEINDIIASLLKVAKKIIKRDGVRLAKEAKLPKYITFTAFTSVPEPEYIDRFKIGLYLNNLFNTIYSEVEENGEFEDNVRWKNFFREIFGKDNVVEVATFILLEGVHRIDKYKSSADVRICWDSLTAFALKELNEAPGALREQMIELYIKRISKMFANNSYDLRVNLLDISTKAFPALVETIEKYSDKICGILNSNNK